MKNLKVDWTAESPWDAELSVRQPRAADRASAEPAPQPRKATKRIVITESGQVLRQCVRAI